MTHRQDTVHMRPLHSCCWHLNICSTMAQRLVSLCTKKLYQVSVGRRWQRFMSVSAANALPARCFVWGPLIWWFLLFICVLSSKTSLDVREVRHAVNVCTAFVWMWIPGLMYLGTWASRLHIKCRINGKWSVGRDVRWSDIFLASVPTYYWRRLAYQIPTWFGFSLHSSGTWIGHMTA
jgi:hypothetical protein